MADSFTRRTTHNLYTKEEDNIAAEVWEYSGSQYFSASSAVAYALVQCKVSDGADASDCDTVCIVDVETCAVPMFHFGGISLGRQRVAK